MDEDEEARRGDGETISVECCCPVAAAIAVDDDDDDAVVDEEFGAVVIG